MKKRDYRHNILLFGLTVILPGLVVCIIAGFAINQEYTRRMKELEYNRESMKGMIYGNLITAVDSINQKNARNGNKNTADP